jgi:hypothetical protein
MSPREEPGSRSPPTRLVTLNWRNSRWDDRLGAAGDVHRLAVRHVVAGSRHMLD